MPLQNPNRADVADRNWRRFVLFRVLFNARFYYPVLAVFFLDLGLSATQYTLLNVAWALSIVAVDVPAGVLADRIGRRPLIIGSAIAMVVEMVLLGFAPRNGGTLLFVICLANRIISGSAEGMASGADEALVFDSLAERGREKEWPLVLDQVMRWQSVGFVVAMLVGGAVYDPTLLDHVLGTHLDQATTLRFPIFLNLLSALTALGVALGMSEPAPKAVKIVSPEDRGEARAMIAHLLSAGLWILRSPLALFVITAGLALDSVVRLFMTFSSSYFRLIHIPPALYGVIGATLGGLGIAASPIARRMVTRGNPITNFVILATTILVSFLGIAARGVGWGVVFAFPLSMAMSIVGYHVSYYLNAAVESQKRATVLSFKGLAFNLGFGMVSLAFAGALRGLRDGNAEQTFGRTLPWLPVWLGITFVLITVSFWKYRNVLLKPASPDGLRSSRQAT